MLTYTFVVSSNKRCTLYKKEIKKIIIITTSVQCTLVIGLLVGAIILSLLVIIFTNSFGIKVSTFHLYHLKIKKGTQVTHHRAKRKREEGKKIRSKKEERSIHETKPCLFCYPVL